MVILESVIIYPLNYYEVPCQLLYKPWRGCCSLVIALSDFEKTLSTLSYCSPEKNKNIKWMNLILTIDSFFFSFRGFKVKKSAAKLEICSAKCLLRKIAKKCQNFSCQSRTGFYLNSQGMKKGIECSWQIC